MRRDDLHGNWRPPPKELELRLQDVDVWRARLDPPIDRLNRLAATLSEAETQRAARFRFPADRNRYVASHGALRDILSRYLRCEPETLTFTENQYGKPALRDYRLEFNLSHSGEFALIAAAQELTVGVDVERVCEQTATQDIALRHFSKAEVADLQALPPDQRQNAFFACWTRKESYIKAQGLGLSLPLESFDVSLKPGEPAVLRATRPDPQEAARWRLLSLEVESGYAAAVAVQPAASRSREAPSLEFRLWDWHPR